MKNLFAVLIFAGIIAGSGCSHKKLGWSVETLPQQGAQSDSDYVEISFPVAAGGAAADSINRQIDRTLKSIFSQDDTSYGEMPLAGLVDSMLARKNRDTVLSRFPFDLRASGKVYMCGRLASVHLTTYLFTGGAHGSSDEYVLNFDTKDGRMLSLVDFVSDTVRLKEINQKVFSQFLFDQGLDKNAFFVDTDRVPLPENIGFDSTGMTMHYNAYDIAPYVFGATDYTIPYGDVELVLKNVAQK